MFQRSALIAFAKLPYPGPLEPYRFQVPFCEACPMGRWGRAASKDSRCQARILVFLLMILVACGSLSPNLAGQSPALSGASEAVFSIVNDPVYRNWRESATLRSLTSISQDRLVAVGDRGTILVTRDAGRTWSLVASPTTANLHDVHFDGQTLWAVGGWIGRTSGGSYAAILKSSDAGITWTLQADVGLPRLLGIQSQGPRLICWGDYCPRIKSSVFVSSDGGFTWQAGVKGISHAAAAGSNAAGHILAIDALGRSADSLGASNSVTSPNRLFKLLVSTAQGWLAGGEAGQLAISTDGFQWSDLALPIAGASRALCDWHTVAQQGNHLWLAGSPGSMVLHSSDGGKSWTISPTGQSLPIYKLCFIDAHRGWAVGAQGTLLATRDGGRNWYAQRQMPSRASVLAFVPSTDATPWAPLVATIWDHKRCAAVVSLQHNEPILRADLKPSHQTVCAQASRQIGLSDYMISDSVGDDPILAEAKAVLQILCWRPDVVLSAMSHRDQLSDAKLPVSISSAIQRAASDEFRALSEPLYLKPWKVQKLAEVLETGRGDYSEQGQRVLRDSGLSVEEILLALPESDRQKSQQVNMRTLWARSQSRAVQTELLGGTTQHPESRVVGEIDSVGSYQSVMGRGHRDRMLKQLMIGAQANTTEEHWQKEFRIFAQLLPPRDSMGTLSELVDRLMQLNQHQRACVVLDWMSRASPDQDASSWIGSRMIQLIESHYRHQRVSNSQPSPESPLDSPKQLESTEMTWSLQKQAIKVSSAGFENPARETSWATTPFPSETIALASASKPVPASADLPVGPVVDAAAEQSATAELESQSEHIAWNAQTWLSLADQVLKDFPEVRHDPHTIMLFARSLQESGKTLAARTLLGELTEQPQIVGWHQAALQELALLDGQENRLKWTVRAAQATQPPQLDGNLTEQFWSRSQEMQLTSLTPSSSKPTSVRWAYDREFLYIAIECHRNVRRAPAPAGGKRSYDADLSELDYVELSIDPHRDYRTAYEFAVAENGWTSERFGGKMSFNPKWYVQAITEAEGWRAEIAIPLEELNQAEVAGKAAWTVSARRLEPNSSPHSWSQLKTHLRLPQANGLLLLE